MNKYVKGLMLFGSGMVSGAIVGSAYVGLKVLSTDEFREVLAKKIGDKVTEWIYGEEINRYKTRRVSYRNYAEERRYDDVIFNTREDAEKTLHELEELCEKYDHVTVADVYEIAGIPANYTHNNFGWYTVKGVEVKCVRDGYTLGLPTPVRIY